MLYLVVATTPCYVQAFSWCNNKSWYYAYDYSSSCLRDCAIMPSIRHRIWVDFVTIESSWLILMLKQAMAMCSWLIKPPYCARHWTLVPPSRRETSSHLMPLRLWVAHQHMSWSLCVPRLAYVLYLHPGPCTKALWYGHAHTTQSSLKLSTLS